MIIRLIVFGIIFYMIYRALRPKIQSPKTQIPKTQNHEIVDTMVQDPVCKVYIPKEDCVSLKIGEKTEFFCSTKCRDEFIKRQNK